MKIIVIYTKILFKKHLNLKKEFFKKFKKCKSILILKYQIFNKI